MATFRQPAYQVVVIVPTLNNAADLERCLAALGRQQYRDFTILVVDSHSVDRTRAVAAAAGARYLDTDTTTRADACNAALSTSAGELVAFTDDDCIPPPEWLGRLVAHFADRDLSSVGGPSFAPPGQPLVARAADVAMAARWFTAGTRYGRQGGALSEIDHNSGCNAVYRREAIALAGGFPPGAAGCEDLVLDARLRAAGGRIRYDPAAWTHHRRRESLAALYRMGRSYGRGRANAGRLVRSLVRPVHWLPAIAVATGALLVAAALAAAVLPAAVTGAWRSPLPLAALLVGFGVGFLGVIASPPRAVAAATAAPQEMTGARRAPGR